MGFQMHINMDMFLPICNHELFGTGTHNIWVASVYVASTQACDISEAENKIYIILFHLQMCN